MNTVKQGFVDTPESFFFGKFNAKSGQIDQDMTAS
jgi:hypothetical protein